MPGSNAMGSVLSHLFEGEFHGVSPWLSRMQDNCRSRSNIALSFPGISVSVFLFSLYHIYDYAKCRKTLIWVHQYNE